MPEHDVLYHELLEALQAGGCAICRLARRASDSYLHALIYEGVTDPALRERLRDARGPCYRHAWRLANQRGAVLGTAIIYRDVINTLLKALEAAQEAPAPRFRLPGRSQPELGQQLAPAGQCPACHLERDAEQRTARILLQHVDDSDIRQAYITNGGLCLPHFREVLAYANGPASRSLGGWQAEAWRRLRTELDELIRKHDHRFRHEPVTEAESVSWQRAVAAAAGESKLPGSGDENANG